MLKQLKIATVRLVAGANIATILVMLAVGYSDRIYPADYPTIACMGLVFPILLLANLAFVVLWTIFKKKMLLVPIIGYALCWQPLTTYIPWTIPEETTDEDLKVLSYNVLSFGAADLNPDDEVEVLDYIRNCDADIVCLQECNETPNIQRTLERTMKMYEYRDTIKLRRQGVVSENVIGIWSKYPIVGRERIIYTDGSSTAGTQICRLLVNGDTITVINNHLENCHLDKDNREAYKVMLKGKMESDTLRAESRLLIDRLGEAAAIRCHQADSVAALVSELNAKGKPVILCGDFNDNPISYTHHVISKELTDCFVAAGRGPGISYNRRGFYVRIDNIMCSQHFKPKRCFVDSNISASDHYPMVCWMQKR